MDAASFVMMSWAESVYGLRVGGESVWTHLRNPVAGRTVRARCEQVKNLAQNYETNIEQPDRAKRPTARRRELSLGLAVRMRLPRPESARRALMSQSVRLFVFVKFGQVFIMWDQAAARLALEPTHHDRRLTGDGTEPRPRGPLRRSDQSVPRGRRSTDRRSGCRRHTARRAAGSAGSRSCDRSVEHQVGRPGDVEDRDPSGEPSRPPAFSVQ